MKWSEGFSHCSVSQPTVESHFLDVHQQFVKTLHLVCEASTAPDCIWSLVGQRGGLESAKGQTALNWTGTDSQLQNVAQWENTEKMSRKGWNKKSTLPYCCSWDIDGLLSMSYLFSLSGLPSIQPLHRHSGWVSQPGYSVYVRVCLRMQSGEYLWSQRDKFKMIHPMKQLIHSPLPKPISLENLRGLRSQQPMKTVLVISLRELLQEVNN